MNGIDEPHDGLGRLLYAKGMVTLRGAFWTLLLALWLGAPAHSHGRGADSPATSAGVGVAAFDLYSDGTRAHLLLADFGATGSRTLLYRQSRDDGRTWSDAVQIDTGGMSIHAHVRGNDPQIAAQGDRLVAVWKTHGPGYGGSGPLAAAISDDGGRTWRAAPRPSNARSRTGEAYADLHASAHGFDLVWLDARDGTQGLRHARLAADAKRWSANVTVQKSTCECCWNSLVREGDALYVLFRGRNPRDMVLSALPDAAAAWERRSRVGAFGWSYRGCPHTGGGLARNRAGTLHAVIWTGASHSEGLHYLRSRDAGRSWSMPHPVGSADARRADIAAIDDGVAIVWDQLETKGRAIYTMTSHDGGERWLKPVRISTEASDATYPRIVVTRAAYVIAWTQREGGRNVLRTHVLPLQTPR